VLSPCRWWSILAEPASLCDGHKVNIFVSGSHGLIGSALIRALRARGDEATPIGRSAGRLDLAGIDAADAVVHLAGAPLGDERWSEDRKRVIMSSREDTTQQLVDALTGLTPDERPSVLVNGSAVGFYGDRGDEVLTESSESGCGFLAEVCRRWEAATEPAAAAGIRVVRLRTGIVLSAAGGAMKPLLLPFKLGLGGRIGTGRQWFSWVALDDEVGAILHALDNRDVSGALNATAPNPVTYGDFARTLAAVLHRPAVIPTPTFAVAFKLGKEGAREMVLSGQRVVPAVLQRSGYSFVHPELRGALEAALGKASDRDNVA
jgi:uncharacterized protein (TIGR01777 family)